MLVDFGSVTMSAVSASASARDRRTEVRRLIDSMEHAKIISDGHFSALMNRDRKSVV